jgi:hypothetical protein
VVLQCSIDEHPASAHPTRHVADRDGAAGAGNALRSEIGLLTFDVVVPTSASAAAMAPEGRLLVLFCRRCCSCTGRAEHVARRRW